MAYGGRVAEELIFGHDRVTTGAASDIQKATSIARRYVTQWGLSDAIGPILVGDNEQELFLGREIQHRREVSEQTAQLVDAEVKRVHQPIVRAREGDADENIELLHQVAAALLERETLTREDIEMLSRGERCRRGRRRAAAPTAPVAAADSRAAAQPAAAPRRTGAERRREAIERDVSGTGGPRRRDLRRSATRAAVYLRSMDSAGVRDRALALDRPLVIGDRQRHARQLQRRRAFRRADRRAARTRRMLVAEGADVLDIGGESTRPQGATPVSDDEELRA